ncbi:uncharacterized protein LOC108112677 [Drosophila eugracilis]|uniref:uncharacterized protein LOC108112677 n=1 Tax=Drosophila eugracilis TaxID=29029 RepID=UPI0007E88C6B|nr:uncharacterized protein LOC108112677 [Drosophila eugracilis]
MMCKKFEFLLNMFLIIFLAREAISRVDFKNIKCESVDKQFCRFDTCALKSVNRSYKYLTVYVKLFKLPVSDVKVDFGLYQRLNGYKPFLYNFTVDACKFFKNQKSNPVGSYFYEFFRETSNLKYSCPYNHDIVVDKVSTELFNHRLTKILPFPEGEYMVQMNWHAYGINRGIFKIYFALSTPIL